eukprot:IDg21261t1
MTAADSEEEEETGNLAGFAADYEEDLITCVDRGSEKLENGASFLEFKPLAVA